MSLFSAIDISGTGVDAMQTWIDTSAGNIANADDDTSTSTGTYAAQVANFTPIPADGTGGAGQGVEVTVTAPDTAGEIVPDPSDPTLTDGEVRAPAVNTSDQLVNLMSAQDDYQADTAAISRATAAYQSALTIGG